MAVFTIAQGQTLRMDKMVGNGSAAVAALVGLPDGTVEWRWTNTNTDPATVTYDVRSTGVVFTPPFSDPENDANLILHSLGDITLDMQFFDPEFGPGPVGTLTGTVWSDVTLYEHIYYVNIGGPDPLQPADYIYLFSFDEPVLFGGDDVVTLGAGDDVFYDYGGALEASLGAGDDLAWLYEAGQNVTDIKYVDAGDGNDTVYFQSGNGTILGGAGSDLIQSGGNGDGIWLFNGGAGRDQIDAVNASRIEDDKGSGNDQYSGQSASSAYYSDVVLSYASGDAGIVADLVNGTVSGGGHGLDSLTGISAVEGTAGNDLMIGMLFSNGIGGVWGVRFWGMDGNDTINGAGAKDLLDGGGAADLIDGGGAKDKILGGAGDDTLTGGGGADRLVGGGGADDFVFARTGDSKAQLGKGDVIIGFEEGVDDIDLSALGTLTFNGDAAATGPRQIWVEHDSGTTYVLVNIGGGVAADMRITLDGLHTLTGGDFIL